MTISDDKLLAYADGLLSPAEIADIDKLLVDDGDAREILASLKQSDLPYREAAETLIDVPNLSHITAQIQSYQPAPRPSVLRRFTPLAASIAVFFVVGLLAGQHVFPPATPKPTQWAVWVDRIASYQALYTRDTLPMGNPPAARKSGQMLRVSKFLGAPIIAPDLAKLDADYKYAKIFAIGGQPLAQIAYLPKSGVPFSLCLMKTDKPDHGPKFSTAHGLNVASWRAKGIAYVYVGKTPRDVMDRYIDAMRTQTGA
ncbi:MAG: anti-sigma factor RsiW [Paracoccaceae bacterium]|jgi:anti-sigma factor RsiW